MRLYKGFQFAGMLCICGTIWMAQPFAAQAAPALNDVVAQISGDNVSIYQDQNENSSVVAQLPKGSSCDVLEDGSHGWVKVSAGGKSGYLEVDGNATLAKAPAPAPAAAPAVKVDPSAALRQHVVDYALQFVGGRYRYGGTDPHTGVDCSGFTRYVLQNAAGVSLNRSSGDQARQGKSISAAQIQPGDLVFYGSGKHINHVALYIGNGQIVHASTESTGIKVSNWLYRSPIKIVSVLG